MLDVFMMWIAPLFAVLGFRELTGLDHSILDTAIYALCCMWAMNRVEQCEN